MWLLEKDIASHCLTIAPLLQISFFLSFAEPETQRVLLLFSMHYVTRMLETTAHVRRLFIDFQEAFDRIDHVHSRHGEAEWTPICHDLYFSDSFFFPSNRIHTIRRLRVDSTPYRINLSIV